MIDPNLIKITSIDRKREGMQPVTVWNDVRITHLPTGIAIEVPHEYAKSQYKNIQIAMKMLEELEKCVMQNHVDN